VGGEGEVWGVGVERGSKKGIGGKQEEILTGAERDQAGRGRKRQGASRSQHKGGRKRR